MKMRLLSSTLLLLLFCSCAEDSSPVIDDRMLALASRTVIVYMSAENNLGSGTQGFADKDIAEMARGCKSLAADVNLVVFVDKASPIETPYIARVTSDEQHPLDVLYSYPTDFYSSDPDMMTDVLQRIVGYYPVQEDYGLVLWGHGTGWAIDRDSIRSTRAYGIDSGDNSPTFSYGKWLNIPSLRMVLERLGIPLKFILFDCCSMQSIEVAYELRNCAEYIIGSPAEIPTNGASYYRILPFLFSRSATFYEGILQSYAANSNELTPLSVIKTSELESLAVATYDLLPSLKSHLLSSDMGGYIYYGNVGFRFYDMKDVIKDVVGENPSLYIPWISAYEAAVVARLYTPHWTTNGQVEFDFDLTEERYGGVSMFFPAQSVSGSRFSPLEDIRLFAWYHDVGWN